MLLEVVIKWNLRWRERVVLKWFKPAEKIDEMQPAIVLQNIKITHLKKYMAMSAWIGSIFCGYSLCWTMHFPWRFFCFVIQHKMVRYVTSRATFKSKPSSKQKKYARLSKASNRERCSWFEAATAILSYHEWHNLFQNTIVQVAKLSRHTTERCFTMEDMRAPESLEAWEGSFSACAIRAERQTGRQVARWLTDGRSGGVFWWKLLLERQAQRRALLGTVVNPNALAH